MVAKSKFFDSPGLDELRRTKDVCSRYNSMLPSDREARKDVIRNLFGKIGESFEVYPTFWCDHGKNIEAGENFFLNHGCVILDSLPVRFGDNVLVGPNCGFYSAGHPIDAAERIDGVEYAKPITVGSDVWIGGNVSVLQGVTIGDNVVIGAGSVVTKDIPSNCIAAGNPCRVIRAIS